MKPTRESSAGRLHGKDVTATSSEELLHFQNYSEYSKTLRAWLVAYGIGGPVLFFTNKDLTQAISQSPDKRLIITLFMIGVMSQVFLAFINKWCAWHIYAGEHNHRHRDGWTYKFWAWINKQSIIDVVIDIASLSAFAYSTWLTLQIFA